MVAMPFVALLKIGGINAARSVVSVTSTPSKASIKKHLFSLTLNAQFVFGT
jgi:hypothetical protein